MTKDELNNAYFEWMYQLVCNKKYRSKLSYRKLLCYLHGIEYEYHICMDENRAIDGIDLRYRFGCECGCDTATVLRTFENQPCSILEMLIALSIRCEEHIMDDPDIGNRTGQWFWNMIENLGLGSMRDSKFDRDYSETVIARFLNQKYEPNGKGGLFTVRRCNRDLRSIEIWYQMCWYLDEVLKTKGEL